MREFKSKFGPGDPVKFKRGGFIIDGASILLVTFGDDGGPAYHVVWFVHGTRHGAPVVAEFELEADEAPARDA